MPRFFCPVPLADGALLDLPAGAARHVQVLRLQPGDSVTLFDGGLASGASLLLPPPEEAQLAWGRFGGEFEATITAIGRSQVQVRVGAHTPVEREAPREVHLALGMPANERMDWLVEKATELGVASIQPLMTERSVLRLGGERAEKKRIHWQGIAISACEQCGRNRVPVIHSIISLAQWLPRFSEPMQARADPSRLLLSLQEGTRPLVHAVASLPAKAFALTFLSGPEGGLSIAEELDAIANNFKPVSLGPRVLRAETASLTALILAT